MMKMNAVLLAAAVAMISTSAWSADMMMKHKGLECTNCHAAGAFLPPDRAKCLACHAEEGIVKATERFNFESYFKDPRTGKEIKSLVKLNPHDNFHYGRSDQCVNCHKEHKKSTITCELCHDTAPWKMKAPR